MQNTLVKKLVLASALIPAFAFSSINDFSADVLINKAPARVGQAITVKEQLMTKLSKLAFFSANFNQQIISENGELLQQGGGNLAISKPNLVNWRTTSPDETLIVSDGNTLWFYDPFIEQASAYSLAKSIHNTPILLLTSDAPQLWQQYHVTQDSDEVLQANSQQGQRFIITPIDKNSQIKRLTLRFNTADVSGDNDVQLSEFSFQDASGQVSKISLSDFNSSTEPSSDLFKFTLPQGVRLEDKR